MRAAPFLALALAVCAAGCEPTCKNTCEKLLSCDDVEQPRVSVDDCETSCENQERQYDEDWDNQQLADELADAKECIMDSECADIADGACYNPDLYVW